MLKYKKLFILYSGIGGATKGFLKSRSEYKGNVGRFRVIGAVDVDPLACQDHETISGVRPTQMDLFTWSDYVAYHGHEPPVWWREATARDIREAAGGECPDVVFLSPPCKGNTPLLPKAKSLTPKYQALNNLTYRGLELVIDAFIDDLPAIFLLENVPGIKSRGAHLLDKVQCLLEEHGYECNRGDHNCGEVGGLGQNRIRFLLIARNKAKVPNLVYRPPRHKLRSIGSVIGPMPMPGDPDCGPMHELPRLWWLTWKRLAMIRPGCDHRYLEELSKSGFSHSYYIVPFDSPTGTVTGGHSPSSGCVSVGDTRLGYIPRMGALGVNDWECPSKSIIGSARVNGSNGVAAVGYPGELISVERLQLNPRESRHPVIYRVVRSDEVAPCITGARFGSGALAYGDIAFPAEHKSGYNNKWQVLDYSKPASTVTGIPDIQAGAQSVGDLRFNLNEDAYVNLMKVTGWDNPAGVVTGAARPAGGALSVGDIRSNTRYRNGTHGVNDWEKPSATIIGCFDVHCTAAAVGDPRRPVQDGSNAFRIPRDKEQGVWVIISPWKTWNRPITALEACAIQSFDTTLPDGSPLVLAGESITLMRERIGQAVPPDAAMAMGEQMLDALLVADEEDWTLGYTGVWVIGGRREEARRDCYGFVLDVN